MYDLRIWNVIDYPTCLPCPKTVIGIFLVSKKQLIQVSNIIDNFTPD
jgi:hypothetical protein